MTSNPTVEKIKEFLLTYYGPENPNQKWFITLTVLAILMLPRSTRRLATILFCVACVSWLVAGFLFSAFKQYTPGG